MISSSEEENDQVPDLVSQLSGSTAVTATVSFKGRADSGMSGRSWASALSSSGSVKLQARSQKCLLDEEPPAKPFAEEWTGVKNLEEWTPKELSEDNCEWKTKGHSEESATSARTISATSFRSTATGSTVEISLSQNLEGLSMQSVRAELLDVDKEERLEEMERDGMLFQTLPPSARDDRELARMAAQQNPMALEHSSEEIRNDMLFVFASTMRHLLAPITRALDGLGQSEHSIDDLDAFFDELYHQGTLRGQEVEAVKDGLFEYKLTPRDLEWKDEDLAKAFEWYQALVVERRPPVPFMVDAIDRLDRHLYRFMLLPPAVALQMLTLRLSLWTMYQISANGVDREAASKATWQERIVTEGEWLECSEIYKTVQCREESIDEFRMELLFLLVKHTMRSAAQAGAKKRQRIFAKEFKVARTKAGMMPRRPYHQPLGHYDEADTGAAMTPHIPPLPSHGLHDLADKLFEVLFSLSPANRGAVLCQLNECHRQSLNHERIQRTSISSINYVTGTCLLPINGFSQGGVANATLRRSLPKRFPKRGAATVTTLPSHEISAHADLDQIEACVFAHAPPNVVLDDKEDLTRARESMEPESPSKRRRRNPAQSAREAPDVGDPDVPENDECVEKMGLAILLSNQWDVQEVAVDGRGGCGFESLAVLAKAHASFGHIEGPPSVSKGIRIVHECLDDPVIGRIFTEEYSRTMARELSYEGTGVRVPYLLDGMILAFALKLQKKIGVLACEISCSQFCSYGSTMPLLVFSPVAFADGSVHERNCFSHQAFSQEEFASLSSVLLRTNSTNSASGGIHHIRPCSKWDLSRLLSTQKTAKLNVIDENCKFNGDPWRYRRGGGAAKTQTKVAGVCSTIATRDTKNAALLTGVFLIKRSNSSILDAVGFAPQLHGQPMTVSTFTNNDEIKKAFIHFRKTVSEMLDEAYGSKESLKTRRDGIDDIIQRMASQQSKPEQMKAAILSEVKHVLRRSRKNLGLLPEGDSGTEEEVDVLINEPLVNDEGVNEPDPNEQAHLAHFDKLQNTTNGNLMLGTLSQAFGDGDGSEASPSQGSPNATTAHLVLQISKQVFRDEDEPVTSPSGRSSKTPAGNLVLQLSKTVFSEPEDDSLGSLENQAAPRLSYAKTNSGRTASQFSSFTGSVTVSDCEEGSLSSTP